MNKMIYPVIAAALIAFPSMSASAQDTITCHFSKSEAKRSFGLTMRGQPGQKPGWMAQTIRLQSNTTNLGQGVWIGVAEAQKRTRLAEISLAFFRQGDKPAGGISIAAAPVMNAVSVGLMQGVAGSKVKIAPEPVWGVLKVDGKAVHTDLMTPRVYGGGKFLEMSTGYLSRKGDKAPYGVDAKTANILRALLTAKLVVTLELYARTGDEKAPLAGLPPLASYSYLSASFPTAQKWAQQLMAPANAEYAKGCPKHRMGKQ